MPLSVVCQKTGNSAAPVFIPICAGAAPTWQKNMKPYLVDVPVKVNIWIRSECQKRQFEVIKEARPSILFLQSDGGRNDSEWQSIIENRSYIDNGIDWDCKIYRLYEDHNNGLYAMGAKMRNYIWNVVDRCIFLEDDNIPSVSFFRFCAELLEKYKDDQRIECICGFNTLNVWEKASSDYFFSRQGSIWGTATWKRVADEYGDFSYGKDDYIMGLLKERTKGNDAAWKQLNGYAKNEIYDGHPAASEFHIQFHMYSQNRLQIIPKYNLIENAGANKLSFHEDPINQTPKGLRCLYNSKTYNYTFPLKHPKYVIPDVEFEKKRNRVMGKGHPIVRYYRFLEKSLYKIRAGEGLFFLDRIKNRISARKGETTEK